MTLQRCRRRQLKCAMGTGECDVFVNSGNVKLQPFICCIRLITLIAFEGPWVDSSLEI